MGKGLEKINQDKRKYDTSMNTCKYPHSLEQAGNHTAAITVVSANSVSGCNNYIMTQTEESKNGSDKPY